MNPYEAPGADSTAPTREFTAPDGTHYSVQHFRGLVSGVRKDDAPHKGSPYFVPDHVQKISLTSSLGEVRTFELTDFRAACSNGDLITVALASRDGTEPGPCIALDNNSTQKAHFSGRELTKLLQPACLKPQYLTPIMIAVLLTFGLLAFIIFPTLFLAGRIAARRVTRFTQRFVFEAC